MTWQTVTSGGAFFKFENAGDTLEGVLTGSRVGEYGTLYQIAKADGSKVEIGKSFILDAVLPQHIGKVIRIEYRGKKPTKSGKTVRDYVIAVSDEDPDTYVSAPHDDENDPF